LVLNEDSILSGTVNITGIRDDGGTAFHFIRKAAMKNIGGVASLVGSISTIGTDVKDNASYDTKVISSGASFIVQVKGGAGETIRVVAVVDAIQIGF